MISSLASSAFRNRKRLMVIWALLLIVVGAFLFVKPPALRSGLADAPGSESERVTNQLRALHASKVFIIAIVDSPPTDEAAMASVDSALEDVREMEGVFAAHTYIPGVPQLEGFISDDGSSFAAVAIMDGSNDPYDIAQLSVPVGDRMGEINDGDVTVGGDAHVISAVTKQAKDDATRSEMIAVPFAMIALVLLLGGWRAGLLPLLASGSAILLTTVVFVICEMFTDLTTFAMSITSLLGIGLGIDYGLLIVARFREELAAGHNPAQAVANTTNTAGRTVIFSAVTVAISMCGLFFIPGPQSRSFAIAGVSVALAVAFFAVVFLPPLLGIMWRRVKPKAEESSEGRFGQIAIWVQARPGKVAGAIVIVALLVASPVLGMKSATTDETFMPSHSDVRIAATTLAQDFTTLSASPIQILASTFNDDPRVASLIGDLASMEGVRSTSIRPNLSGSDIPVVIEVVAEGPSQGPIGKGLVEEIRDLDPGFEIEVGGRAATIIDAREVVTASLPWAAAWVLGATFVLLFLMTGSVVIPFKAILMNVVVLSATFGVMVAVFQDGMFAGLLGVEPPGFIEIYTPIQVFMFAFGLSMDYEVFLLARIKEVYDRTGDNNLAVAEGIQKTGRVITSAAVLICIVFAAAFVGGELLTLRQFVFALGLAIILDATVIRTLMVPATMTLMGDWNWWAPAPLRRLHDRYGISEHVELDDDGDVEVASGLGSVSPEIEELEDLDELVATGAGDVGEAWDDVWGDTADSDGVFVSAGSGPAMSAVLSPSTVGAGAISTPTSPVPAAVGATTGPPDIPGDSWPVTGGSATNDGDYGDSSVDLDGMDGMDGLDGMDDPWGEDGLGDFGDIDEGTGSTTHGDLTSDELDWGDWGDDIFEAELEALAAEIAEAEGSDADDLTPTVVIGVAGDSGDSGDDLIDWYQNGQAVPQASAVEDLTGSAAVIEQVERSLESPASTFEVDPEVRAEYGIDRGTKFVDLVSKLSEERPNEDLLLRARGRRTHDDGSGYRDIYVIVDSKARRIGRISGL